MKHRLAIHLATGILASLIGAFVVATGLWIVAHGGAAQASHGVMSIGVDADTAGNTATSLGPFDTCIGVTAGNTFEIDIYGTEVTDLLSWEAYLSFNQTILRVDDHSLMLQDAHSNSVADTSEGTPDTSGLYRVGGFDMNATTPGSGASGDGVLARITLFAIQNGSSNVSIEPIDLNDDESLDSANDIGPWLKNTSGDLLNDADENGFFDGPIGSAVVIVGGTDSDGDTVPDVCDSDDDNDTIADTEDNCPLIANVDQSDIDLDGIGDLCDGDADGDGYWNDQETERGSDTMDATSTPEVCDGTDNDGNDGIDEGYDRSPVNGKADCVDAAADTDGDGIHNPNDDDDDGDGFADAAENVMATDSLSACSATPADDAWPVDLNQDRLVSIHDVIRFIPAFNTVFGIDSAYVRRYDINADGVISLGDVLRFIPVFSTECEIGA